jgi:hypothetical protein
LFLLRDDATLYEFGQPAFTEQKEVSTILETTDLRDQSGLFVTYSDGHLRGYGKDVWRVPAVPGLVAALATTPRWESSFSRPPANSRNSSTAAGLP